MKPHKMIIEYFDFWKPEPDILETYSDYAIYNARSILSDIIMLQESKVLFCMINNQMITLSFPLNDGDDRSIVFDPRKIMSAEFVIQSKYHDEPFTCKYTSLHTPSDLSFDFCDCLSS